MEQLTYAQKKERFKKLRKHYEEQCKKLGLNSQDFTLGIDWSLSYAQQKEQIDVHLGQAKPIIKIPKQKKDFRNQKKKHIVEKDEEKETELYKNLIDHSGKISYEKFKKLNAEPNKVIDLIDKPILNAVSKIVDIGIPLVVIEGKQGNGKSRAVDRQIKRDGAENRTRFYTTTITRAYLYRVGYENREKGCIVVLRDINPFKKDIIDMLKAMTDTNEPRIVHKNTYSKENSDLPDSYQFEGSMILEVNVIPLGGEMKLDIDALMSRAVYIPFHLSQQEIKAKMKAIAKEGWQKEVTEDLINTPNVDLNLRTQAHAFKTYQWARKKGVDWRGVMEEELRRMSKPREYWKIYALIGESCVKKTELIRMLVTSERYGIRTARRRIDELIKSGILSEDETGRWVSLKKV